MGNAGSTNSTQVLNESISNATMSVLTQVSSASSASSANTMTLKFDHSNVAGNTFRQSSSISMSSILSASTDNSLQAKIASAVLNDLTQHNSDFPQLTATNNSVNVRNIVQQNVNSSFSTSSIMSATAQLSNTLVVEGNYSNIFGNTVDQSTQVAMTLSNSMAAKISEDLGLSSTASTKAKQDNTFFGSDIIASVGTALGGAFSGLASLGSAFQYVIMFILIIVAAAGGYHFYTTQSHATHDDAVLAPPVYSAYR